MRKRFLCLGLTLLLSASQVVTAFADREADLQQEKAATTSQLESTNSSIWNLEQKTAALQEEINQADAQLVDVMVAIDVLKEELEAKKAEITQTKEDLEAAEKDRDKQYADMKLRIQYIYENGGDGAWIQMVLNADDISSMLNKAEYTQKLYDYDRESLENYVAVVKQVTDLGNQLESEKADLEVMKADYEEQQATLETILAEKKAASADYENQIAVAQEQAQAYRALIQQQSAEIQAIQAEKQRAAEEAARKAAEEAAQKEAAKAAQRQAQQDDADDDASISQQDNEDSDSSSYSDNNDSSDSSSYDDDDNDGGSSSSSSASDSYDDSSYDDNSSSSDSGSSDSSSEESAAVSYSGTGQSVVDYACQFVGNPYVWGGSSLTSGADCSGFIMSVYARFGVSLPHSSASMRSCGVSVSYSQAMPGDIICYSGHVAIYMGGGAIVHASNAKDGIKISGNAAYRTILSVRRVI